jgi:hypothetical protein
LPALLSGAAGHMLNVLTLQPILADMAKQPTTPPLYSFDVFKAASKAVWLATIEATDECDAIERVASVRDLPANKLIAARRRMTRCDEPIRP